MKKNIIIFYLSLLCITGNAQNTEIIPASPTVAELAKYGKIPVSYYTGQPNINIPLYHIKCGTLDLPISLSYSPGIKVDQVASWVGLGWSLNAGGIIQSSVVGKTDLENNDPLEVLSVDYNTGNIIGTVPQYDFGPECLDEPDIYSFNFCGYSGQFIFDKDRSIHFLKSDQKLKITEHTIPVTVNSIERTEFTAIDNMGIIYKFELNEWGQQTTERYAYSMPLDDQHGNDGTGLINDPGPSIKGHQTAWFLTEIVAPNGIDKISLEYDSEIEITTSALQGSLSYAPEPQTHFNYRWYGDDEMIWYPCVSGSNYFENTYGSFTKTETKNETKKLKKIICTNGVVIEFIRTGLREDLKNYSTNQNKSLNEIRILYKQVLIKKWNFTYNYFQSSLNDINYPYLNKRLRLSSIQEYGSSINNDPIPPFKFYYYGDDAGEMRMPFRTCYSGKDYFGYCNRSVTTAESKNVKKIFPKLTDFSVPVVPNYIFDYACADLDCAFGASIETIVTHSDRLQYGNFSLSFPYGSDRKANIDYAKSYTLKQIDYPTGGSTLFEYELHTFNDISDGVTYYGSPQDPLGGLRIKKITDIASPGNSISRTFTYGSGGILMDYPIFAHNYSHIATCYPGHVGLRYNMFMIESAELNSLYSISGEYIGYKSVTENIEGNGKVIYQYYSGKEFPARYNTYYCGCFNNEITFKVPLVDAIFPYYKGYSYNDYARGVLKEISYLNTENDTVRKEIYKYNFNDDIKLFGNQTESLGYGNYRINIYHYNTGLAQLKEKILKDFYNSQNAVTIASTKYSYNSFNLINEEKELQSDGSELTTKYKYPPDYLVRSSTDIEGYTIGEMANRRILNMPIEIIKISNQNIVNGRINTFQDLDHNPSQPDNTSGRIVPFKNYILNINSPISQSSFVPSDTRLPQFLIDSRYTEELSYEKYDAKCNPTLIITNKEVKTSYLWDYDFLYPVAKAFNATNDQIAYSSFELDQTRTGGFYGPEWTCGYSTIRCNEVTNPAYTGNCCIENQGSTITSVKTFPAGKYKIALRTRVSQSYSSGSISINISAEPITTHYKDKWTLYERIFTLNSPQKIIINSNGLLIDELQLLPVNALMTTYTYKPLIGLTSETDPNGVTTYYEYDSFGRLKLIRDDDGNILETYEYHYKP